MDADLEATWLLFDGDCRICSAAAAWVQWLSLRRRLQIRPIQESQGLLRGVSAEAALGAIHVVAPDGRVAAGAEALPLILSALVGAPGLERLLRSSPLAMTTLSRTYDLLVELRGQLSCAVDAASPAACTPR